MIKRFTLARRLDRSGVYAKGQYGVRDRECKTWTPVFVLPMVARQICQWLNDGTTKVDDLDWSPDDGHWEEFLERISGKFDFMSADRSD